MNILVDKTDTKVYTAFIEQCKYKNGNFYVPSENCLYPEVMFIYYENINLPEDFIPLMYKYDGVEFKKVEEVAE